MVSISTDTNQHNCFFNERYPTDKDRYPHIEVESTSTEDIVWYQILGKW